ncbi:hypothetical protein [Providencia sp. PROV223]|uniref:hypothetical protein n=1 Tax=Providencia sp. PROV223 TaxID=2949917 RepID=UPI002349C7E7|nr:hypothetical protein [Providencia sp. PROV223]
MDSLKALAFIVGYFVIIYFIVNYEHKKKSFEIDAKPLSEQTLFRLAIIIPIVSFLYFGVFAWWGKTPVISAHGFKRFIEISTLPLGLLSLTIPFTAVINNIHRTIQTNEQIEQTKRKSESDLFYSHRKDFVSYVGEKIKPSRDVEFTLLKIEYNKKTSYSDEIVRNIIPQKHNLKITIGQLHLIYYRLYYKTTPTKVITLQSNNKKIKINNLLTSLDKYLLEISKLEINKNDSIEIQMEKISKNANAQVKISKCINLLYLSIHSKIESNNLKTLKIQYFNQSHKEWVELELSTLICSDSQLKQMVSDFIKIYNIFLNYDGLSSITLHKYPNIYDFINLDTNYITFCKNNKFQEKYDFKVSYTDNKYKRSFFKKLEQ